MDRPTRYIQPVQCRHGTAPANHAAREVVPPMDL